ncbi:MAG: histidine ammonia-lyase [Candidatus Thermoplasmatota archaeon]|nr:histidine ammonia-lyase [Candidatus Thermoplasmatota archaeon]
MSDIVSIDGESLTHTDVLALAQGRKKAVFPEKAREQVNLARNTVLGILERGETAYGINTGFGSLSKVSIGNDDLEDLQANLIRSHACALGEDMHPEDVLAMMVIRANSLAKGNSGVRADIVDLLLSCIHSGIAPRIPRIGSLGASGDLAPLAHLALGLMGEGDGYIRSTTVQDSSPFDGWRQTQMSGALKLSGLQPLRPQAKEGLSLINGTTQMCAWLSRAIYEFEHLLRASDIALALSVEALNASHDPFDERLHEVRNQPGQRAMAVRLRSILNGGAILAAHADCDKVQDSYSLRCAPQVHGPAHEALWDSTETLSTELNSATDNPLIFPDPGNPGPHEVVSGGNFHGQVLGLCADRLALVAHELAVISERRTNQLLDPVWSGLPAYLAKNSGLESGLMIVQYVAAAAIAEMHVNGNPATLSNVSVSNNKEDHVSMGATACHKLNLQNQHLSRVISCEIISAVEALGHNQNLPSPALISVTKWIRERVPELTADRSMGQEIEDLAQEILAGKLSACILKILPDLA